MSTTSRVPWNSPTMRPWPLSDKAARPVPGSRASGSSLAYADGPKTSPGPRCGPGTSTGPPYLLAGVQVVRRRRGAPVGRRGVRQHRECPALVVGGQGEALVAGGPLRHPQDVAVDVHRGELHDPVALAGAQIDAIGVLRLAVPAGVDEVELLQRPG
ncbi:hypothetical protein [Ornithinimicrobium sp. Y1694]|uniref:hypothetical protein n=1 Tax=Ornithinimicrobium sp. Y1694 TaxID=3418590 RepID=UPI003CF81E06